MKQRDWLDYLSTGAATMQALHVSSIEGHLQALARSEANHHDRQAQSRRWREFMIEQDEKLDAALAKAEEKPKASYASARLVQEQCQKVGFSATLFEQWEDIDRAKAFLKKMENVLRACASRVPDDFHAEVTLCFQFAAERAEMERLIKLKELDEAKEALRMTPLPFGVRLCKCIGGILICSGLLVIVMALIRQADWQINTFMGAFVALIGVVMVGSASDTGWGVRIHSEYNRLRQEIAKREAALKEGCDQLQVIPMSRSTGPQQKSSSDIARQFGGDGPSTKFVAMRAEREKRWDGLFTSD